MGLRPYQERAIAELRKHHRNRPLLTMPTGAGKTSVAAEIIRSAVARGHRCIFLVHRRELVEQAVQRLAADGILAGQILAGEYETRDRPVQVASIPTLLRRAHWPAQLVIVDECSHAVSDTWSSCLGRYPDSWIIGLTATPIRLDGRGLGDLFGCIVEPATAEELIRDGWLIRPEVYAPPVDLSGVRIRMGDYSLPQLAERMTGLVGSLTGHWLKHARGLRTVAFAVNVEHSLRIVEAFQAIGVRAAHLDGTTATLKRKRIVAALRAGTIDMVSNCAVLSEGFDVPDLQCAILARPTKSLALYRQMVGRIMRPPGPAIVLDHAGNTHEHGPVTDAIEWDLHAPAKRRAGVAPARTCKECFAVFPVALTECPACGAAVPIAARPEPPIDAPGELVRLDLNAKRRASEQEKQSEYRNLVRIASQRGYKLGWARGRYKETFGTWPRLKMLEQSEYHCRAHEWEDREFGYRRVRRCTFCYAEVSA